MAPKRKKGSEAEEHMELGPSGSNLGEENEPGPQRRRIGSLPGKFIQYPITDDEPHPGIGALEDLELNAVAMMVPERRNTYHPVTASLVFLCMLIPGLHSALAYVGVPEEASLTTPRKVGEEMRYTTSKLHGAADTREKLSSLEISSMMNHCCSLIIGVIIGASDKVRAEAQQIKKRFRTMMASLGKPTHADAANHLQVYNPAPAVDWLNAQPWVGSLVLSFISTNFDSPGKEFMDQMKLVAQYAQMTTYTTMREYLDSCMDATLTIPIVLKEIDIFLNVEENLKAMHGEFFKYLGAIRHPDASKLAPREFPNLASAARYWSKRENPTMSGYKASTIQAGATIKEPTLARLRNKEIKRGEGIADLDEEGFQILARIGVTK